MNKLIVITLVLTALAACFPIKTQAQMVIYDEKTTTQVSKNTGLAVTSELANRNKTLDMKKKNDSIAAMSGTIALLKTIYHNAKTNFQAFGEESRAWIQVKTKITQIYAKVPKAIQAVVNNPLSAMSDLPDIMFMANNIKSLARQYTAIVANGRVSNPFTENSTYKYFKCPKCGGPIDIIKTDNPRKPFVYACKDKKCGWDTGSEPEAPDEGGENDGYNFLSYRDRYQMVCDILRELNGIDWRLTMIIYNGMRKINIFDDIYYIDRATFGTLIDTKSAYNRVKANLNKITDFN